MLIVLNDNGMSISRPQGAFSEYLERVRVSTTYEEFKRVSEKLVHKLPSGVGHARGVYLQPGDVVEIEIERLGLLRNPVEAA